MSTAPHFKLSGFSNVGHQQPGTIELSLQTTDAESPRPSKNDFLSQSAAADQHEISLLTDESLLKTNNETFDATSGYRGSGPLKKSGLLVRMF